MKFNQHYIALCTEADCFNEVREDDIERDENGIIYERSKKCWDCRTSTDRKAIKKWRQKHSQKLSDITPELPPKIQEKFDAVSSAELEAWKLDCDYNI